MDHHDDVSEKDVKGTSQDIERHEDRDDSIMAQRRLRSSVASTAADRARRNLNAKLANPLDGYSFAELEGLGRDYAKQHAIGDTEDIRAFELGAVLAQAPEKYEIIRDHCSAEEMDVLDKEFKNRWSQPKLMYLVIVLCSTCAAVQGMGKLFWLALLLGSAMF
jgi:hypothetical protein